MGPNVEPGKYDEVISTVDIGKTLLNFADLPIPDSYRGYSAVSLLTTGEPSKWDRNIAISESGHAAADSQVHSTDRRNEWRICARDGDRVLVYHVASDEWTKQTEWNRFDAASGKWTPLEYETIEADSITNSDLQKQIKIHLERVEGTNQTDYRDQINLDESTEDQLEELGYL